MSTRGHGKGIRPRVRLRESRCADGGTWEHTFYSHFHALEIPNAHRLKQFRGEINEAQEAGAIRTFLSDVDSGVLTSCRCDLAEVSLLAERLSFKHSAVIGSRSLDLLHVAAAMESGATSFASFDSRQRKVASLSGLHVIPWP